MLQAFNFSKCIGEIAWKGRTYLFCSSDLWGGAFFMMLFKWMSQRRATRLSGSPSPAPHSSPALS